MDKLNGYLKACKALVNNQRSEENIVNSFDIYISERKLEVIELSTTIYYKLRTQLISNASNLELCKHWVDNIYL